MAEFTINPEEFTGVSGKIVVITGDFRVFVILELSPMTDLRYHQGARLVSA